MLQHMRMCIVNLPYKLDVPDSAIPSQAKSVLFQFSNPFLILRYLLQSKALHFTINQLVHSLLRYM